MVYKISTGKSTDLLPIRKKNVLVCEYRKAQV